MRTPLWDGVLGLEGKRESETLRRWLTSNAQFLIIIL